MNSTSTSILPLNLKLRPLQNRNPGEILGAYLLAIVQTVLSHLFTFQDASTSLWFYEPRCFPVPLIRCLPVFPSMNALSRWTFVHHLARVKNHGWKSTSTSAPAAKPHSFEHPSFRCFQCFNLQYVSFSVMSHCPMTVADATDAGFTFFERLVSDHRKTSL